MGTLWIALPPRKEPDEAWAEVERYLYGRPYVEWDTGRSGPAVTEDPRTGLPCFRVRWPEGDDYAAMTRDRLASGLVGARLEEAA